MQNIHRPSTGRNKIGLRIPGVYFAKVQITVSYESFIDLMVAVIQEPKEKRFPGF